MMEGQTSEDPIVALMRNYLRDIGGAARFLAEFDALVQAPHAHLSPDQPPFAFMTQTDWSAVASSSSQALVSAVSAKMGYLPWFVPYRDDPTVAGPGFAERAMATVHVGPRGSIHAPSFASGFFAVGPDVTYFDHKHEPTELYLPIAGKAEFWNENQGWHWAGPDTVTVHEPWHWHAMRTGSEPILIFWAWLGPEGFGVDPICRPTMAGEALSVSAVSLRADAPRQST